MSRFFVGQRVRLVVSKRYLGLTGRISALGQWRQDDLLPNGYRLLSQFADCVVEWGRQVADAHGTTGYEFPCTVDRLEPILPDGHRAGEEGRCELLDELLERQMEAVC